MVDFGPVLLETNAEKLGIRQPKDFSDLVADVPSQKKRAFLKKATCVHRNLYLFALCNLKWAELLYFPWCESFLLFRFG